MARSGQSIASRVLAIARKQNGFDEYRDLVEQVGDAQYNLSIGFGDSEKLAGLTVTTRIEETRLPFGNRNTQDLETDKYI